jgi:alkylation response protein AidB-like acyl-CoA dehydrogenase
MTEPDTGSDAFNLITSAVKKGDRYVNGAKTFITNAPIADVFVAFAATDRSKGFAGLSAFLVDRETPGVSVGAPFHKMGLRTSPMSEVIFSDCDLSADRLLGPEGAGAAIFNPAMDWERSCILASADRCSASSRCASRTRRSVTSSGSRSASSRRSPTGSWT